MWQNTKIKQVLSQFGAGDVFNESVAMLLFQVEQHKVAKLQYVQQVQNTLLTTVQYPGFQFQKVDMNDKKYICLLGETCRDVDWSVKSIWEWTIFWEERFIVYFVVSCMGRLTTVFNAYSCATRDRLLAANFGQDSDEDMYTYVTLIKMLGAK